MIPGLNILEATRITRMMQAIQDVRQLPAELLYLNRTATVPAFDGEIMARFVGRVQIADLVADDARAVTYSGGKVTLETSNSPNIKHGQGLTQEQLNQLLSLVASGSLKADGGLYSQWENRTIDSLLLGIRQRMEALIVAMHCDGLTYNRLGIVMTGVTWGMPADLKVTVATAWTDAVNGDPVGDMFTVRRTARVRYGLDYTRVTMSLAAFLDMIACAKFQAQARMYLAPNVSFVNLPQQDTEFMRTLAANVLGMKIEIYDQRFWQEGTDGVKTSIAAQPINKVVLTNPANDNNEMVYDFANGVVTESIVASLLRNNMIGNFGGPTRGPVAYATAPPDLNPPNIVYWGVARGFPRRHLLQMNAVLTVGNLTDPIPVGEPF